MFNAKCPSQDEATGSDAVAVRRAGAVGGEEEEHEEEEDLRDFR